MGDEQNAIADVARALKINPHDPFANRRMLVWGNKSQQIEAARNLVRQERDLEILATATEVLHAAGHQSAGAIDATDSQIIGWAAWKSNSPIELTITDGSTATITDTISSDPSHPLRHVFGNAASFRVNRPETAHPQLIALRAGGHLICEVSGRPNTDTPHSPPHDHSTPPHKSKPRQFTQLQSLERDLVHPTRYITIIIAVYEGYEATKACLESLLPELEDLPDSQVILIDDATPNRRIRNYLKLFAAHSRVRLLRNDRNLGFVHSVNRAFEEAGRGDVLLLNADTLLPPGCIARMHAVAHSNPRIGTVTPLSNNGEIMSFPIANKINPLPSSHEISRADAAAATANAGKIIDVPNGIGFCLYITQECFDLVRPLSELYQRGYFEDVDLCLRAREHGFINVCAPSIYVGHAGSLSFGSEKQSLLVRNLAVLETRFPSYGAECSAFLLADPLRSSRELT